MNLRFKNNYYLMIPLVLSLILVLVVTLSNKFPLSWDIYTHMNYALAYMHDGITNVDYLLNAPTGKTIGYPPFFHIVLIITSYISASSLVDSARILQVILTLVNVLTIIYVSNKIFDDRVGFFAGLLLLSSLMFTRFLLPIPETLAMVFFTLTVYCYYKASSEANYKYSLLAAIFSLFTLITHFSSFVYLMLLLFALMIVQTVILRKFDGISYYVYIIVPVFLMGILSLGALVVVSHSYLSQLLTGISSIISNPFDLLMGQVAMGFERYVYCVGILALLSAIIGLFYSFKKKEFLFVSLWALIAFVITNLHWFGIPVYTYRLLIYLIVPMVLLGGYGLMNVCDMLESHDKNIAVIFIIAIVILSFGLGYANINDSSVTNYNATTEESSYHIAPPTLYEQEVINWFENETVGNQSILTNNLFFGTVISSIDEIPIHYGFDVYTNKSLTKSSLDSLRQEQIGYIIYDKELIINNASTYQTLDVKYVNGSYYPSYYFTEEITENNFNDIKLSSTEKVFENDRFIICKVI